MLKVTMQTSKYVYHLILVYYKAASMVKATVQHQRCFNISNNTNILTLCQSYKKI